MIQILTTYPSTDASRRLRIDPLIAELQNRGCRVEVHELINDRAFAAKNHRIGRFYSAMILAINLAMRLVVLLKRVDIRIVHREAFPFLPPILERVACATARVAVLDVDDAIYESPTHNSDWRRHFRNPSKTLVYPQIFDHILCGNWEVKQRFSGGESKTHFVPTCPPKQVSELKIITPNERYLLWTGSYSTLPSLNGILDQVLRVCSDFSCKLVVLGADNINTLPSTPLIIAEKWSMERELHWLSRATLGLMPLPRTPWENGKSGYKAILYHCAHLPSLVSPIGLNDWLVRENSDIRPASGDWYEDIRRILAERESNGMKRSEIPTNPIFNQETTMKATANLILANEKLGSNHLATKSRSCENDVPKTVPLAEGLTVIDLPRSEVIEQIASLAIDRKGNSKVATALHVGGLLNAGNSDYVSAVRNADFVYADGMSIVALARLGGARSIERASTTDIGVPILLRIAQKLERRVRVALVGGPEGLAEKAAMALPLECVEVISTSTGFLDAEQWETLYAELHEEAPDVVVLGLGCPREAIKAREIVAKQLEVSLVMTCGGWFGFLAGEEKRAPYALRVSSLEWVYRLVQDPARLWRRYLLGGVVTARLLFATISTKRAQAAGTIQTNEQAAQVD
ncbi:WecB/TagA/CpsF family glycosyltransferase [Gordonia sputi]